MTETQTMDIKTDTPTDSPLKRKHPNRGKRKRLLGNGEGDYCIYQIAPSDSGLPIGALIPLPEIPRFPTSQGARLWVRTQSNDSLSGKQIMIFRAHEIMDLQVQMRSTVVVSAKPKMDRPQPVPS